MFSEFASSFLSGLPILTCLLNRSCSVWKSSIVISGSSELVFDLWLNSWGWVSVFVNSSPKLRLPVRFFFFVVDCFESEFFGFWGSGICSNFQFLFLRSWFSEAGLRSFACFWREKKSFWATSFPNTILNLFSSFALAKGYYENFNKRFN